MKLNTSSLACSTNSALYRKVVCIVASAFLLISLIQANAFAQTQKTKVACIGNSITWGYTLPDPATQSYPALLRKKVGDEYIVKNFGHSGATLMRKGYNPYIKTKEFDEAISFQPDIAIIELGVNDTDPRTWPKYKDNFIPDYNRLIDTLRSVNPQMKIYITTLLPVFTAHPRFMSSTFTWFWEVQKKIKRIAKTNNVQLINIYEPFHDRPDLITDAWTLHPNVRGARKLSRVIYKNITGNFGGLKIADIFTDNMVLQRNKRIPVWGIANAGTTIKITFNHQTRMEDVPNDGRWKLVFPPMKAGSRSYSMTIQSEDSTVTFSNILIGDVWLCSGQSNMYFTLAEAKGGKKAAQKADKDRKIRLFKYTPYALTTDAPWDSVTLTKTNKLQWFHGRWKMNTKEAAGEFSAIGYWFGKKVHQKENIPIGLIELAVGGSPLISWVSRKALETHPLFEPALNGWLHSDYVMKWVRQRATTNLKYAKSDFQRHPYDPAYNFSAGIAKITQFPIKGVIWYQGASDAQNPELYSKLFPILVKDWRSHWGYNFPFYYVQLSSIDRPSWPYFRNMQRRLLNTVPNTGMAVSIDVGDSTHVHYKNKKPVGLRLADLALHYTYGEENIVPNGPLVKKAVRKGNKIVITFSQSKGLTTSDGEPLRGFKIMNYEGYIIPVKAKTKGNKIIIKVPSGERPIKVMYGWEPYTTANLINGAGLPAGTFRVKIK